MRKQFILWMILLLTALLPSEFVLADDASAVAQSPSQWQSNAGTNPPRGTLYQVRHQGHTSYLFGTIHVGKAEFFPLEPLATQGLADANVVAIEVDMRDTAALQNAMLKYGMYANSDTVEKHLSAASLQRLKAALGNLGLPYDGISHFKAWMIANLITIASVEKQGYHTTQSSESFLLDTAKAQGKGVAGLESAAFQLSLFDKLTEKQQEGYLIESLNDLESGDTAKKTQDLLDAWSRADETAFDGLLQEAKDDKTVSGQFVYREILTKRNPMMASKIATLMKENKSSFVGVGLLHLIGPGGVPQLLKKKGYEVTRLY
ncbi:MAG TPA: TraB/GumN family protein [Burkholderiaceae bacterium]